MQKYTSILVILACIGLWACEDFGERAIDTRQMKQAIRDRKPQRITPKDLQEWMRRKGGKWFLAAQKDLYKQVKKAQSKGTLKKVSDFASLPSLPVVDSLSQQYMMDMQGYAFDQLGNLPAEVRDLLLAYRTSDKQEVTVLEKNEQLYCASPIVLDNETVGAWLIIMPVKQARRWYDYKDLRR